MTVNQKIQELIASGEYEPSSEGESFIAGLVVLFGIVIGAGSLFYFGQTLFF